MSGDIVLISPLACWGSAPSPGLAAPASSRTRLWRGFALPLVAPPRTSAREAYGKHTGMGLQQRIVRDHHTGAVIQLWIGHPHNCAGDHQRGPSHHSFNIGNGQKVLVGRFNIRR